jgi:N-acetylglucosamine-6-phosphate deacetylase
MNDGTGKRKRVFEVLHCIALEPQSLVFHDGVMTNINPTAARETDLPFTGPGLIDLQVNGVNGIDFNNPCISVPEIVEATHYLLSQGVTTFFPTVITNTEHHLITILSTIREACLSNPLVNDCIAGIHLEGPFISPEPGAKGAHEVKYIRAPDWALFTKFQEAAGGKIKLTTLAPEWEGSAAFIEKCRQDGILVSIGHSMANSEQVRMAIDAGASLSTHLGNAVPLLLPRHPNIIWDQLAAEELYACIICDGLHIPDSFIKVVIRTKGAATLLVSDATCFTGKPPGEYENHIGGTVILDEEKRLSLKSAPGLLAGAARTLLENVEYLIKRKITTPPEIWQMASANVAAMLRKNDLTIDVENDLVIFRLVENRICIEQVIKKGVIVYES